MSRFFPLRHGEEPERKAHGRIEKRSIDVLPAAALGDDANEWAGLRQIARIRRFRQVKAGGVWQEPTLETAWIISSLAPEEASPQTLLTYNREHWRIENNLHRNKDVTLGEDGATNRKDNAPRNIASLNNLTLAIFKSVNPSPKRAMEYFRRFN